MTTQQEDIIPIGGVLRSSIDDVVAIAAELGYTLPTGQVVIAGDTVQLVLDALIRHVVDLEARGQGTPGILEVAHDNTLEGRGTAGNILRVVNALTAAQVAKLDAIPEASQLIRRLSTFPGSAQVGDSVIVDGVLYHRQQYTGAQTVTLVRGDDPVLGSDDEGYQQGSYGDLLDANSDHIRWCAGLWHTSDDQAIKLRIVSLSDPGSISLDIPVYGRATMARVVPASSWESGGAGRYEYSTPSATSPFPYRTDPRYRGITITPTSPITFWESTHLPSIANFAKAGSSAFIPDDQISTRIARTADVTRDIAAALAAYVPPAGDTEGLNQSQVDARVAALVSVWALGTDNSDIPTSRIPADIARQTAVQALANMVAANTSKLAGIDAGAEVNPTAAEIKTEYESNADTNAFTDDEKTKLAGIATGAQVNPSDAAIKTAYENNADTNAFTDSEKALLATLPDPRNGTTGYVPKVNSAAAGSRSYELAADRVGTGGGGLDQDDVDNRIEAYTGQTAPDGLIAADRIPEINQAPDRTSLPPKPWHVGQQFTNISGGELDYRRYIVAALDTPSPTINRLNVDYQYIQGLYSYSAAAAAPRTNRSFVATAGAPTTAQRAKSVLWASQHPDIVEGGAAQTYTVAQAAISQQFPHLYLINGLDYATFDEEDDLIAYNIQLNDDSWILPDGKCPEGVVHWNGTEWLAVPAGDIDWDGVRTPVPPRLLPHYQNGQIHTGPAAGAGLNILNTSNNRTNPATPFVPAFNLDENPVGIFFGTATLNISTSSNEQLGFGVGLDQSVDIALRNVSASRVTEDQNLGGVDLLLAGVKQGRIDFILDYDSSTKNIGFHLNYTGESGTNNLTIGLSLELSFLHNDPGPAPTGGGGQLDSGVLVDWTGTTESGLVQHQIYEFPAATAFVVTEAQDNDLLQIEYAVGHAANTTAQFYADVLIKVSEWRNAPNGPAPAANNWAAVGWGIVAPVFVSGRTNGNWGRFVFTKGANGRPALMPAFADVYPIRLKINRISVGGGG